MILKMLKKDLFWRAFCACILTFLLIPAVTASEEIYKFERMWPTLKQPWLFGYPLDVATDRDGFVYLTSRPKYGITKLTSDGVFVGIIGDSINLGLTVFDNYVFASGGDCIRKFRTNGEFLGQWCKSGTAEGEFNLPRGLAADSEGKIYVADSNNNRIQKFTIDGEFILKWGSQGSGEGEFSKPLGIYVDYKNFVYVTDLYNNRVQKFTSNGEFVEKWEHEFLWQVWDISGDGKGLIYVLTRYEGVLVFTDNGQFIRKFGGGDFFNTYEEGKFWDPEGMMVSNEGFVYVADTLHGRVQKFYHDGTAITHWGSEGIEPGKFRALQDLSISGEELYVTDYFNERIQKFGKDGSLRFYWKIEKGNYSATAGPVGLTTDKNGNVWVAIGSMNCVQEYSSKGTLLFQWGEPGDGEGQFNNPYDVAVDGNGFVFVLDRYNHRVQKFQSDGRFVIQWTVGYPNPPEHSGPERIAVDSEGSVYVTLDYGEKKIQKFDGNGQLIGDWGAELQRATGIFAAANSSVYVTDEWRNEIFKYTSDGSFMQEFGTFGSGPGQFNCPRGIAGDNNGLIAVADVMNDRVQLLRAINVSKRNMVIIVAGGGGYPGNDLWDATQMSANFAYRTLTYQGFTKESIHYLSSANIDLDDNGVLDDVAGNATNANLRNAILSWATGADDVILYLVDHGGEGSFRMSGTETLTAAELSSWLDTLQSAITGKVIVIYDACGSGSFVSPLKAPSGKQRIVITSTSPDEKAYFLTQGSVSFSNYFWTHIFNGVNITDAFNLAKEAITHTTPYQNPLLDANGNGIANEEVDFTTGQNAYIGNGTVIYGSAPVITEISSEQTINNTSSALLYASRVTDADGIARVWAVIRPPDYRQGSSASPVQDLPSIDFMPVGNDRYEATYAAFSSPGTYQVAIYARDRIGNTSIPKVTQVSVVNPLRRRAIIVAAGSQSDALWPAIERNTVLAYDALKFQGYGDDDIYFMSPVTFSSGVDVMPTLSNLNHAITSWAATNTQDLVLYLIGSGGSGTIKISPTETLSASDLKQWLDTLQENIPGKVVVIYDGPQSGSFLPTLAPPSGKQRILVSSTGSDQPAHFLSRGDLCFSRFFWSRVSNGMNLRDAYLHGKRALSFLSRNQVPFLDDNGNGIGNEKADGQVAMSYTIGFGIALGADDPLIGSVSPAQTLTGQASATIWAKDVTTTGSIVKVWAVIAPPGTSQTPDTPVTDLPTLDLIYNQATNQYEGTYYHLNTQGQYIIAIFARDVEGNISLPATTTVTQTVALDPYEDDNTPNRASVIVLNDTLPQKHAFDVSGDEDWVKFYALAGEAYEVKTENLGARCDTVLTFYGPDGTTVIKTVDDGSVGEGELLSWQCDTEGVYYVKVAQYDPVVFGEFTHYDLRLYVPAGPPLVAFIKGRVTDSYSGEPMGGVKIKTDAKISALSLPDGNYLMVHPAGTFSLTAEAKGCENFADTLIITEAETVNKNIVMDLIALKGDINRDRQVNLTDAVLALRVMIGLDTSGETITLGADVNGDSKIGVAEVIYILQKAAGLR